MTLGSAYCVVLVFVDAIQHATTLKHRNEQSGLADVAHLGLIRRLELLLVEVHLALNDRASLAVVEEVEFLV